MLQGIDFQQAILIISFIFQEVILGLLGTRVMAMLPNNKSRYRVFFAGLNFRPVVAQIYWSLQLVSSNTQEWLGGNSFLHGDTIIF